MGHDKEKTLGEAGGDTAEQGRSVNVLAKVGACLGLAGWFCLLLFFGLDLFCVALVPGLLYSAPLLWFVGLVLCIVVLLARKKRYLNRRSKGFAKAGLWVSVIPFGIIILFLATSITAGWYTLMVRGTVVEIKDVTSKATQILASNNDPNDRSCSIDILITGHIDGSARIHLTPNKEKGMADTYSIDRGKVHLRIGGDWYYDECILEYEPADVNSGSLAIRYVFYPCD